MTPENDKFLELLSDYDGTVQDRQKKFLVENYGYDSFMSLNDMEYAKLEELGYEGSLNDKWHKYIIALGGSGLGVKAQLLSSTFYVKSFTPLDLFAASEEGAWYEPSTSTAFTDTGGTTAATYGDAVAYMQDLSGNGNHATQATAASRPILARVPEGGRRNELNATDTLATQSLTVTAAERTLSFKGTGTVTLSGASTSGPLVGTGAEDRVSLTFTPSAASLTLTVSGTVTDAQLELGNTATAYQSVVSEYDITEEDVTSLDYLSFDGVDDCLVVRDTKTVPDEFDDWSDAIMLAMATNATVVTGTSAGGFASANTIFSHREDSNLVGGAYKVSLVAGYEDSEFRLGFKDSASTENAETSTFNPSTNVNYVQLSYVDGDNVEARFDGSSVISTTLSSATGVRDTSNGRIDIFIGARTTNAGSPTNYFTGQIYNLIYRKAVPTTDEIDYTEAYLATKSGVTL